MNGSSSSSNGNSGDFPKNIEHMFESFHQSSNGEFKPTFYNPFEIKHRRRTTKNQFKVLERAFEENPKPNNAMRRNLAAQLDMSPRGVQVWFQNRRAKKKHQESKAERSGSEREPDRKETTPQSRPRSHSVQAQASMQRRFSVQPSQSNLQVIDAKRRMSADERPRIELSQVLDDIYLPDHIYNPDQSSHSFNPTTAAAPLSPPVGPASSLNSFGLVQTSVPMTQRVPIPQPKQQPHLKIPCKMPIKRNRANSCPNVHKSLPFDELHSLLFNQSNDPPSFPANNCQPPIIAINDKPKGKKQGGKRAISPISRQNVLDGPKRQRAVSVPSLSFTGDANSSFEVTADFDVDPSLPQIVLPLKGEEDDMNLPTNGARKPRKNSGCSMNFLNSFINMGFIPESQAKSDSPATDPYYQAIMRGGKLGLQDMYLCEDQTLETIAEIDQNIFASHAMLDPASEAWNPYIYQAYSDQNTLNYFPQGTQMMMENGFEYYNYVNSNDAELFPNPL